ncbi:helix-turn-helix domain-containing protein [Spirillospora sp. NPDC048911]|uniref:helix-turn-helix domain-containing protein n=1 Tax=Spirillospora sp. NPDC048911 TaxID=3364527 RepID=UPI00371B3AD9
MVSEKDPERPTPRHAATPADFVAVMRQLKSWTGLSFRQLERQAAQAGEALPRTTVTSALSRDRVPQEHLVIAFARACGCDEQEIDEWAAARRRIAAAEAAPPVQDEPQPRPTPPPGFEQKGFAGKLWHRRLVAELAALAVLVAAGVAVILHNSPDGPTQRKPLSITDVQPTPLEALQLPPPTEAQLRRPPAAPAKAPTVLYVGDSIATETSSALTYFVHRSGKAKVVTKARTGAALCDYLQPNQLPAQIAETKPRLVVLQFWGHSSTCTGTAAPGSDEYYERYHSIARQTAQQIGQVASRLGIPRPRMIWILQGPDRARPERIRRLNEEIYQPVADEYGDLVSDAGQQISMAANVYETVRDGRYRWTAFLPCDETERRYGLCTHPRAFGGVTQLHPEHDAHQLCRTTSTIRGRCTVTSPGVIRYTTAIARTITESL